MGEELREKLIGLVSKNSRMLAVVTSRPYGEGRPSHAEGFEVLNVQPLADREIQDFSHRFFRQCYGKDEVIASREAGHFWNVLERSPEPRALARTALLLTMMLLIGRVRRLPDKRHLLYESCIDNLLTALPDRKAEEGALLLHEQWRPEDSEERKRVVAGLAFALQDQGYKSYNRSAIVRDWDGMVALLPAEWSVQQKMGFLGWLAGPAGLLTDRADGTLTFTHLSFQEYLAAWHLNANIEGAEERIREFERQKDSSWWETLRLWAALIEKQSPDRLDPVLEALASHSSSDRLALLGAILADGLGNELRFERWKERWRSELWAGWVSEVPLCARSWAASRQEARRQVLIKSLYEENPNADWLGWTRMVDFLRDAAMLRPLAYPRSLLSRSLIEALYRKKPNFNSIAAGRIFCSGPPFWPADPLYLGYLQVWPGDRRIWGLRLQSAAALGISRVEASELLRVWPRSEEDGGDRLAFARDLAKSFVHHYFYSRGGSSLFFWLEI